MRPPASGMQRPEQNDESGAADAEPQSTPTRFAEHVSVSTSRDPGTLQGREHTPQGRSEHFAHFPSHADFFIVNKCKKLTSLKLIVRTMR